MSGIRTPRPPSPSFGAAWFEALVGTAADALVNAPTGTSAGPSTGTSPGISGGVPAGRRADLPGSMRVGSVGLDGQDALLIAVVADPAARLPRARGGEVGLEEGWALADVLAGAVARDQGRSLPRPIVLVVDVPSQAYGYVEELVGLHQALAAAVAAAARARMAGHPLVALITGKAVSGAFLAFGLQADRIVLLDHEDVTVQVMSRPATARITRRSPAELDRIAELVPATAHDGASFAALGAVHSTVRAENPAAPTPADTAAVLTALAEAAADARAGIGGLSSRMSSPAARQQRAATREVRERIAAAWRP